MSNPIKKPEISRRVQRVVAEILTQLCFCEDLDDVTEIYNRTFAFYMLESDPFTGLPCSIYDYQKSVHEYEKQTMLEKYDHCDGLED